MAEMESWLKRQSQLVPGTGTGNALASAILTAASGTRKAVTDLKKNERITKG
jgi:hypothetical protein